MAQDRRRISNEPSLGLLIMEPDEKARRVYYQDIVYCICTLLETAGFTDPGKQIIRCGTVENPSTELQDKVRKLINGHQRRQS